MGQDQLDKFLQEQLAQHQSPIDNDALWKGIKAKKNQEIESIVKDKLTHHESAIDSQAIWNNISAEVTGKPSIGWLTKSISLLMIIGLLSSILIYTYNNKSEVVSTKSDVTTKPLTKQSTNEAYLESIDSQTTSSQENINNSNTNIVSEKTNAQVDYNNTKQSIASLSDGNSNYKVKESANSNQKKAISNDNNSNNSNNDNNDNDDNNDNNDKLLKGNATSPDTEISNNSNALASIATEGPPAIGTRIANNNNNDNVAKPNTTAVANSEIVKSSNTRNANATLIQAYKLNSKRDYSLAQSHTSADDFLDGLPNKDECFSWSKSVECYDYSPKKFHFSILPYTTADYYSKSMSSNSELTQDYLDNRKETQKAQISNRTGLQVVLRHRKGLYVKFGAEVGFLRERFSHKTRDTITEILPNQLLNVDVNINFDTIYTYGNAAVTTISSKNWRVNNSHRTIGVPVLVGYEKKLSKFNIGVELGVLYNIHRSFEGWLLGPPDAPTDAKDYFSSSNDLNITGGFNLNYDLNRRLRLVGLANFRQNMNTINNLSTNEINQKNTIFGLGVGLEIKI